jgi:YidC/Oxa1 family membrane protein insertase
LIDLWYTIARDPMFEVLKFLSVAGSLGLGIIFLTIIVRIVIFPLTLRQLRSTRAMQALQPRISELQKKYGKDKKKLSEETMKLYREAKINPLGCLWPMLIQFPIWIALYQAILRVLNEQPAGLNTNFLWMDLTAGRDFFLAILVMASMYLLQKMSTVPSADPKQQRMSSIMVLVFPLMFGLITLMLPSGLGLYFLMSNIIGIVMQYYVTGWGSLRLPALVRDRLPIDRLPAWMKRTVTDTVSPIAGPSKPSSTKEPGKPSSTKEPSAPPPATEAGTPPPTPEEGEPSPTPEAGAPPPTPEAGAPPPIKAERAEHGKRRDKRKDRGRGHRGRTK